MREAIDYNALSWVRQELGETLKQARHHLEEYAGTRSKESLQACIARLHEARGPLQMVSLKGADLLTGEMEEVLADLLLDNIDQPDAVLELLMQGFLELPEYLYSLRAGRPDKPTVLFPLINSLRANRGELPLEEGAVFSPNLSVRVPATVFDIRADHPDQDVVALAKAARLQFQGGLLDWYRNSDGAAGLQKLIDVLDHLQQQAASEPVARLWWVSGGVAELLRDGELEATPEIKRLFSQVDNHIKRLMDQGEAVFSDILTDDLLKNLLFQVYTSSSGLSRITEIKGAYGLVSQPGEDADGDDNSVSIAACSDELLQTVSGTVGEDIVRIKEQLDDFLKNGQSDSSVLSSVADELHALANMLGMIGMDGLGEAVAGEEQLLRNCAEGQQRLTETEFTEIANTLVAIEDAMVDISATIDNQNTGNTRDDATFRQGQEAVLGAVIDDMSSAKESINNFLRSCGDFDLLVDVPVILNRIHGGLQLAGQQRIAIATGMIRAFIARELVAAHRELSEEDLDTLADAICSIEYCVEELAESRNYGHRAMDIAEESLEKLGYACPLAEDWDAEEDAVAAQAPAVQSQSSPDAASRVSTVSQLTATDEDDITALQVIGEDADPEIVEIFIEEAAEELEKITSLIPAWCADPADQDALTEMRRSFHTLKGSGRMVGAMATGEFSWAIENLVNKLLDGTVDVSQQVVDLLGQVPALLSTLLAQVRDSGVAPHADVNAIARQAHASSKPGSIMPEAEVVAPVDDSVAVATPQVPVVIAADFPVLTEAADPEIVEIFLEEAAEEFGTISISIPAWVTKPEDPELMVELRRSFHTLKGSGRMAGAMRIGEFSCIVESLFNSLYEGAIQVSAGLFTFMVEVPDALSQLLAQVRDGTEPEVDIQEMMVQATTLANGGQLVVPEEDVYEEAGLEAGSYPVGTVADDDVPTLVSIMPEAEVVTPVDDSIAVAMPQVPVVIAADFPVLTEAADPEIVEIFLEEAAEEFGTISISIPAWVTKPEDPELMVELRRSFHTLKGSGRMAGAMRIGEFSCIVESLFNSLYEGAIQVSAGLFTFMVEVPDALSQLLAQVRDGTEPEVDIQEMMVQATTLANGGQLVVPEEDVYEEAGLEAGSYPVGTDETDESGYIADDDGSLLIEIFGNESREHMQALYAWLDSFEGQGPVTDELYRALHTMSGISESAEMPAIGRLADGLYGWVGVLYESHQPVSTEGHDVLHDCVIEISRMLDALPEKLYDEVMLDSLCERIAALPVPVVDDGPRATDGEVETIAAIDEPVPVISISGTEDAIEEPVADVPQNVDTVPELPAHDEAAVGEPDVPLQEDPYADMNQELFGIFVEEAAEIMDASESVLRAWTEDPENQGLMAEFQRQLHTLKGSARMVDLESIGNLSHAVESVMTEMADDKIDSTPELFGLLADSHDRLAEMLEQARNRRPIMPADDLEAGLMAVISGVVVPPAEPASEPEVIEVAEVEALVSEPESSEEPVIALQEDPYADMNQELFGIFVEEAAEIMDASESVLHAWTEDPENQGLMAEFQRQLHTLKGSARMVDLESIGNLSHAVESVMTEIADDKIDSTPELFGLLADSHDRLAEMLEQARNRRPIMPADDLEAGLRAVISGVVVPPAEPAPEPASEPEVIEVAEVEALVSEPEISEEPVEPAAQEEQYSEPESDEEPAGSVEALAEVNAEDDREVEVEPVMPVRPKGNKVPPPRLVVDHDQPAQTRGEQVKVPSDTLDNMVNHAGEINIYRSRMEQQISDYRFNLSELDQTINRLRDQLRQLEMETEAQILYRYEQEAEQANQDFDPLEMDRYSTLQQLSRSLIESISDLRSLQELMENTTRDSETLLLQQSRVSTELQENLIRTRMIPFVSLSPRLRRIARQSARQLDKKVDVNLVGEDGEMDRAVVERIVAPLEHMLRNSVAHGIESPRERKAAGKPVTGKIDIEFERDGSEIVLRITDDGAGMDIDAIRERAIERGLISEDSDLPDHDVIQFVLQTGFSTASKVTQISGRGVGMDVVNSEVKQLGGSLQIESELGKGATFTVRLPYTLAINQAMLVTAGDETFCVPLASVEGVVRFYPEELSDCYGDGQQLFEYGGNEYRLKHLGSLLETGAMSLPSEREQVPVLLVRTGEMRVGFHIEALQGIREVVIKPVGPQLSLVDGISGATILGDGRVVMILDMVAVSRREAYVQTASGTAQPSRTDDSLVVMVVDDSITVRKVTTRLLERNGYKVVTAKDGVDAMGKLQETIPDIMLLDIEMPRMDGFELATHMRNDDDLRHVPIIMITSRTGDKHRERAQQIGVQSYLGKPYQESDLLKSIHGIIDTASVAAGT